MPRRLLPPALDAVDISAWESIAPETLIEDPGRILETPRAERAALAFKYSRAGPSDAYDEIGFRWLAAAPRKGPVPLQTLQGSRLARTREGKSELDDRLSAIVEEEQKLRHRLIDLPLDSAHFNFRVEGRLLQLVSQPDTAAAETWTFPLTAPLPMLLTNAVEDDSSLLVTQRYEIDIPG